MRLMPAAQRIFTVEAADRGLRLDQFLARKLPELSRSRIQQLMAAGKLSAADDRRWRAADRLRGGEHFRLVIEPAPRGASLQPAEIPLTIYYQDAELAVIEKPAGLVVHPAAGTHGATLVHALLHHLGPLPESGAGAARPGIVHRLDRWTSGLMLVARTDITQRRLAEAFRRREVEKIYLALAHGWLKVDSGELNAPIARDRQRPIRMTTRRALGAAGVREASTHFRVLERLRFEDRGMADRSAAMRNAGRSASLRLDNLPGGGFCYLELRLVTGRTHQIRAHLAGQGHPVVGDTVYGAPRQLPGPGELRGFQLERLFLHAHRLAFTHPATGERLSFTSPLPAELQTLLERLRAEAARRA